MKKRIFKSLIVMTAFLYSMLTLLSGCTNIPSGSGSDGKLTYNGAVLKEGWVGVQYSDTVAKATGASSVKYELKDGSKLPEGLTMSADGVVSGMPSEETAGSEVTVVASANGVDSVEAKFTIKINGLDLGDDITITGRRYSPIESQLLHVRNSLGDIAIAYSLKSDSNPLPEGITLSADGLLSGTPTEIVSERVCTVVASADGYTSDEANVTFYIREELQVEDKGTINNFVTKSIPAAYRNGTYRSLGAVTSSSVSASNGAPVTFRLKKEGTLPAGFTLSAAGDLTCEGVVTADAGQYLFTVIASAEQCADVEADFTITVNPEQISSTSFVASQATVGHAYSESVVPAQLTQKYPGVTFNFAVASAYVNIVPQGLTLSSDGVLSGTPVKSVKNVTFRVNVNAEGYSQGTLDVSISIRDDMEEVVNGIFQAEFINMDGIQGAGQSNNPTDEELIQRAADEYVDGCSNDYFIGYTNNRITFRFEFNSTSAVSGARMSLSLASENGALSFAPDKFAIRVNGAALNYNAFTVDGTKSNPNTSFSAFKEYGISVAFDLKEGSNVIELEILSVFLDSNTGGPAIDYLKLENYGSAKLSWAPYKYNLDQPDRWFD